jgi:hypothetical protein
MGRLTPSNRVGCGPCVLSSKHGCGCGEFGTKGPVAPENCDDDLTMSGARRPRAGARSARPPGPWSAGKARTPAATRGPAAGGSSSGRSGHSRARAARRTTPTPTDVDRPPGVGRSTPRTGRTGQECYEPRPGLAPGQVGPNGLAVFTQVPGDRGDRPTLATKRVHVDIVLPCEHERRGSLGLVGGQRAASLRGVPPVSAEPRGWGFSVSVRCVTCPIQVVVPMHVVKMVVSETMVSTV